MLLTVTATNISKSASVAITKLIVSRKAMTNVLLPSLTRETNKHRHLFVAGARFPMIVCVTDRK